MIARTKLQGYALLVKRAAEVRGRIPTAVKALALKAVQEVLRRALVYTPISPPAESKYYSGFLRDSARVEGYGEGHKFRAVYTVAYYAPYAVYVHEVLDHEHAPPTGAKFLERAAREAFFELHDLFKDGFKAETRAF